MDGVEFTVIVDTIHGSVYISDTKTYTRKELGKELRKIANQIERRAFPGWDELQVKIIWRIKE